MHAALGVLQRVPQAQHALLQAVYLDGEVRLRLLRHSWRLKAPSPAVCQVQAACLLQAAQAQ